MKKVLILSFSTIASDPRVMRQIRLLEHDYELTVAGHGERPAGSFRYVKVDKKSASLLRKLLWAGLLLYGPLTITADLCRK